MMALRVLPEIWTMIQQLWRPVDDLWTCIVILIGIHWCRENRSRYLDSTTEHWQQYARSWRLMTLLITDSWSSRLIYLSAVPTHILWNLGGFDIPTSVGDGVRTHEVFHLPLYPSLTYSIDFHISTAVVYYCS